VRSHRQGLLNESGSPEVWQRSWRTGGLAGLPVCHKVSKRRSQSSLARGVSTSLRQFVRRLEADAVKACNLTMRAADKWDSPRFTDLFLASGLYCSQAESRPAHLQLTPAVSRLLAKYFSYQIYIAQYE